MNPGEAGGDNGCKSGIEAVMAFEIHPRLLAGGFEIGKLGCCRLLLKNNSHFSWFIMIPELEGVDELHELPQSQYSEVMWDVRNVCKFVSAHFRPDKLNVGCIGNQVRQLHLHVVGRTTQDPAWPGTVWGFDGKKEYSQAEVGEIVMAAKEYLKMKTD